MLSLHLHCPTPGYHILKSCLLLKKNQAYNKSKEDRLMIPSVSVTGFNSYQFVAGLVSFIIPSIGIILNKSYCQYLNLYL